MKVGGYNLVDCKVMRRLFIFVLAVILAGLGVVPVSASSFFSSNRIGCTPPRTAIHCDGMNMGDAGARMSAAENTSCCFISGLPAQDSPFVVSAQTVAPAPTATPVPAGDIPRVRTVPADILRHDFSPPASPSRLSVFLI
jgi:hypothetical protein